MRLASLSPTIVGMTLGRNYIAQLTLKDLSEPFPLW